MTHQPQAGDFGVVVAPDTVRFERLLPGPVDRVWAYLTDSEKRGQWLASGPMEPKVGGVAELRFNNSTLSPEPVPERYKEHCGEIVGRERVTRFEPPHAFAITWGEGEAAPSEVLFELTPVGDRVRLVVTHSRLDLKSRLDVSGGWHAHLAVLAARLEGKEPPLFWSLLETVESTYRREAGIDPEARAGG